MPLSGRMIEVLICKLSLMVYHFIVTSKGQYNLYLVLDLYTKTYYWKFVTQQHYFTKDICRVFHSILEYMWYNYEEWHNRQSICNLFNFCWGLFMIYTRLSLTISFYKICSRILFLEDTLILSLSAILI